MKRRAFLFGTLGAAIAPGFRPRRPAPANGFVFLHAELDRLHTPSPPINPADYYCAIDPGRAEAAVYAEGYVDDEGDVVFTRFSNDEQNS